MKRIRWEAFALLFIASVAMAQVHGDVTSMGPGNFGTPSSGGGSNSGTAICAQTKGTGADTFAKINSVIASPACTLSAKVGGCSIIDRCDGTPYGSVTETITSGALVAAVPVNITFTQKYKYTGVAIANGFVQLNDGSSGSVLQCPISNAQPGTSAETPTPVCGFDYEPASSIGPVIQVPNNGAWLDHMSFLNLGIVGNENVTDAWQLNGNGVDTDIWSGNVAVCSAAPCSTHRPTGYVLNFTGSGEINTNWITSNVFQGWSKALFGGSQSVGLVIKNNQFADMVGDSTHPIIDLGHGCCFQYDFEDNSIQNMSAATNTIVLQLGNTGRVANNHWENDNLSHLATGGGICDANLFFYRGAFTTNNMNGGASAANDAPAYALCGVTNFNDAAITNNNITNYAVAGENVSGFATYRDNAYYADKGSVSLLEHAGAPSLVSSGLSNPLGPVGIFGKNLIPDSEIKNGTAYWTLNGVMTESLGTGPGSANIFTYTGTGAPQAAVYAQSAPFPVTAGDTVTCSGYEDLSNVPTGAHPIWGLYSPNLGTQYAITFVTLGTKGITPIMQYVVAGGVTQLTMVATSNSATATTGQPVTFAKPMCQVGAMQTPYVPNIGDDLSGIVKGVGGAQAVLTGATPTLTCTGNPGIYDTNYEVQTGNITAVTTPANGVCPKGKIIHFLVQQSASGGPFTVVAVASWTPGSGTTFGVAAGLTCTIGSTQGATGTASVINYDLINGGPAGADDWEVLACPTVR